MICFFLKPLALKMNSPNAKSNVRSLFRFISNSTRYDACTYDIFTSLFSTRKRRHLRRNKNKQSNVNFPAPGKDELQIVETKSAKSSPNPNRKPIEKPEIPIPKEENHYVNEPEYVIPVPAPPPELYSGADYNTEYYMGKKPSHYQNEHIKREKTEEPTEEYGNEEIIKEVQNSLKASYDDVVLLPRDKDNEGFEHDSDKEDYEIVEGPKPPTAQSKPKPSTKQSKPPTKQSKPPTKPSNSANKPPKVNIYQNEEFKPKPP